MGYETQAKRHGEILELIGQIWDGERNYEDHDAEMKELYLLGQSFRWNENEDVRLIGKKTKALVKEIDEYIVLSRYYKDDSRQMQKQLKTLRKIMTAMVNAMVRLQKEGEVSGF